MGGQLRLHTGNRLERLLDALADRMQRDPLGPLQTETIVVPGQGTARWLVLELARRHSVAAAIQLPFPAAFVQQLCRRADARHFHAPVLAFRIFRLLGDARLQRELDAAAAYCADDGDQQKRLQLALRLAQCFESYQLQRPELLLAWTEDRVGKLPHERFQARLWRALVREVEPGLLDRADAAGGDADRGGNMARAPARQGSLFAEPEPAPASAVLRLPWLHEQLASPRTAAAILPPRLSVFGVTALPEPFVELLAAIARHRDVDLYCQKATRHWYGDARRARKGAPAQGHALVAAWGRQSRDFFDQLLDRDAHDVDGATDAEAGDAASAFVDPGERTLLAALQSDLLHLRERGAGRDAAPRPLSPDDDSVRVHGAHGPLRQMEIVRDQILDAMQRDQTLRPGDVMVLVPDQHFWAPYVHAAFLPVQKQLPFHVADRSPLQELPIPAAFVRLCSLPLLRFSAPELLLLLEEPAIAATFAIARPDLLALRAWVQRTRVRWGLSAEQKRRDYGLPAEPGNTWQRGIDRLLLGLCTGPNDEPVLGLLPAADGTASRLPLLERFVAFLAAVADATRELSRPHTPAQWAAAIEQATQTLFTPQDDDGRRGRDHLLELARDLRAVEDRAAVREELSPAAFREWLLHETSARGEGRGFLSGAITFAALRPMRAVPVRVLAVCGLEDGEFPRQDRRPAFDLQQHERRRGDRDARDDDRQLFLDTLLSARDRLVLCHTSRSQKDNSECAPSTVLSELLEHLDEAFAPPPGFASVRDFVTVQHPLQAFSPRYGADDARLFTYGRVPVPPALVPAEPADAAAPGPQRVIALADLLAFWRHPTKWFCRNVLDLVFREDDDRESDAEPFVLHNLDKYILIDDAVHKDLVAGDGPPRDLLASRAVLQTGLLPHGALGRMAAATLDAEKARFVERVARERGTGVLQFAVSRDDWTIEGQLEGLRDDAQVIWRSAAIRPKDRLAAMIRHAVLCAVAEDRLLQKAPPVPHETLLLGIGGMARGLSCYPARDYLSVLVAGYREGQSALLPFFEKASAEHAKRRDEDPRSRALMVRKTFEPAFENNGANDQPDAYVEFAFPDSSVLTTERFDWWATQVYGRALTLFEVTETDDEA